MAGSSRAEERARADLLRGILDLALGVARIDASHDPAAVPPELRSVVRHAKVVPRARAAADRAGADDAFRGRIAEAVDPAELTPAERLWLERPEEWEAELDALVAVKAADDEEADARRSLARERRARRTAEEGRARAEDERDALRGQLDAARGDVAAERGAVADALARAERAEVDRADAVRRLKELEAAHARLHEQVREQRAAAEADAPTAGADPGAPAAEGPATPSDGASSAEGRPGATGPPAKAHPPADVASTAGPAATAGPGSVAPPVPVDPGVAPAVARAATAASVLADALAEVASRLGAATGVPPAAPSTDDDPGAIQFGDSPVGPTVGDRRSRTTERRRRGSDRRRAGRRPAALPGGVHDDSTQAADHLVRLRGAVLLVDGYNASMATWPDRPIDEQRRRLVSALDGLEARVGVDTTVVFDGIEAGPGPSPGAGRVRVAFTDAEVEADDLILDLVDLLPADRPVVVATDDRRVRDGARRRGANVIGIPQLRALLG